MSEIILPGPAEGGHYTECPRDTCQAIMEPVSGRIYFKPCECAQIESDWVASHRLTAYEWFKIVKKMSQGEKTHDNRSAAATV